MASATSSRNDDSTSDSPQLVTAGRISGVYGVKGWVRLYSHTEPRDGILGYSPWYLERDGECRAFAVEEGRRHGKGVVARLAGVEDRDAAQALVGSDIAVKRGQLGVPKPGEYYWIDLEGLEVVTTDGTVLGVIDHLFETGANDVMVVVDGRERLIPFVEPQVVREVDFSERRVVVDWSPDF